MKNFMNILTVLSISLLLSAGSACAMGIWPDQKKEREEKLQKQLDKKLYDLCDEIGDTDTTVDKDELQKLTRLLDAGASTNYSGDGLGTIALHKVVKNRKADEVIKALLEHKADPNQKNIFGNTPLSLATQRDNSVAVDLLLNAKADPGQYVGHGDTKALDFLTPKNYAPARATALAYFHHGVFPVLSYFESEPSPLMPFAKDYTKIRAQDAATKMFAALVQAQKNRPDAKKSFQAETQDILIPDLTGLVFDYYHFIPEKPELTSTEDWSVTRDWPRVELKDL